MNKLTKEIWKSRKNSYETIGYYIAPKIIRYDLDGPVVESNFVLVDRCIETNQLRFKRSKDRPYYRVLLTQNNVSKFCDNEKHIEKIIDSINVSIESFKSYANVSKKHYDKFGIDFKFILGATK